MQKFVQGVKVRKNNKKKWLFLSVALLSGFAVCCVLYTYYQGKLSKPLAVQKHYFVPVEISGLTSTGIPYLQVAVEGKMTTVKVDLGYSGCISLPSEFLDQIDEKSFIKCRLTCGLGGKKYESNVYEVPKIEIGGMTFFQTQAEEVNLEFEADSILLQKEKKISTSPLGRLGWYLFYNFNVLLDCQHSTLAFCDSLDTLQKQGYPVESFVEAPLILDRDCIEFEAMTQTGPLRCLIDTGATWNILNKDLEAGRNDHMIFNFDNVDQHYALNPENKNLMLFDPKDTCELSFFKIGGKEFGPVTFNRVKAPLEIEAIIGMEFFESTLVFIDFSNRKIYFFEPPTESEVAIE